MGERVNIREFKTHLSAYLRRVKAGEVVVIAERGKPIGRLIPEGISVQERMELMAKMGLVIPGREKLQPEKPVAHAKGDRSVAQQVVEDRK